MTDANGRGVNSDEDEAGRYSDIDSKPEDAVSKLEGASDEEHDEEEEAEQEEGEEPEEEGEEEMAEELEEEGEAEQDEQYDDENIDAPNHEEDIQITTVPHPADNDNVEMLDFQKEETLDEEGEE